MRIWEIRNPEWLTMTFGTGPYINEIQKEATITRLVRLLADEWTLDAVMDAIDQDPVGVSQELYQLLNSHRTVLHAN